MASQIENSQRALLSLSAAIFFGALALNLAGIWALPLTDRDEAYYAQVSREMRERGDYLVPHFNGKPWLEKPPLLYWAQAAAFAALGENEFAARLPSSAAGAGTAALVFGFAFSLFGNRQAAFRSAAIFALAPAALAAAKLGMTDSLAVFFTTLSAWGAWELLKPGTRARKRFWWWAFYAGAGIATLAKGPVGILPLLAVGLFVAWVRPERAASILKPARGLVVALGIAACWYIPAYAATGGGLASDFLFVHVIGRVLAPSNGHGARNLLGYLALLPFYVLLTIPAFFPWSLWLPRAGIAVWRAHGMAGRFLLSGVFVIYAAFSLASTKLPFYILPAFPLLSCAVGPAISPKHFRVASVILAAAGLLFAFAALPVLGKFLPAKALAESATIPPQTRLALEDNIEPSFIWYARKEWRGTIGRIANTEIPAFISENGPRALIFTPDPDFVPPAGTLPVSREGFNLARGRWETYMLLVFPPPASSGGEGAITPNTRSPVNERRATSAGP